MELCDLLNISDRPAAFRVLPCLGVFRDERHFRFGFVYQPPAYIENLEGHRRLEGKVAQLRRPKSLLEKLQEAQGASGSSTILPLGNRFQLARNLAESLYVMHATGWVHKK